MKQIIVDFNTMWGEPFGASGVAPPSGWHITTDHRHLADATAVVFHIPSLTQLPTFKPPGQLWVAWSMEASVNYPLLASPAFMRMFDLAMTYRLDSSVPIPYSSYYGAPTDFCAALRKALQPKQRDRLALLFVSSPFNRSRRFEFVGELMHHLNVHSFGRQMNNRTIANDQGRATKLELAASYYFTLALENAIDEDYVTEKFFDPLVAGSVPVYLGAPNVDRFSPGERCFINVNDFASPRALADALIGIAADEDAYASYHAWRERPLRKEFLAWLQPQALSPHHRLVYKIIEHLAHGAGAKARTAAL